MAVRVETIPLSTNGSGAGSATAELQGEILEIVNPSTALNAGTATLDITVARAADSQTILAVSDTDGPWRRAPRQATHATDGSASLYADTGEPVEGPIPVSGEITVTVAQGGASKSGSLLVYYRE